MLDVWAVIKGQAAQLKVVICSNYAGSNRWVSFEQDILYVCFLHFTRFSSKVVFHVDVCSAGHFRGNFFANVVGLV